MHLRALVWGEADGSVAMQGGRVLHPLAAAGDAGRRAQYSVLETSCRRDLKDYGRWSDRRVRALVPRGAGRRRGRRPTYCIKTPQAA
jgi:hypothetical protein